MFKRILVPLDGSELAESVLAHVERVAPALGAEVLLLRVTEPSVAYLNGIDTYVSADLYQQIIDADTAAATDYLNGVAGRLTALGITTKIQVEFGQSASTIIDAATQATVPTLVMMTTHGRSGLARFALGSVAELVVREASTPVYLVRALSEQPAGASAILVPVDGSKTAEAVLPAAESLARPLGLEMILLRVLADGEVQEATDYITEIAGRLRDAGIAGVKTRIRPGPPADVIVETAKNENVALIAMATHGRTGLRRWVLGSVTDGVVHSAELPMLLVRGGE